MKISISNIINLRSNIIVIFIFISILTFCSKQEAESQDTNKILADSIEIIPEVSTEVLLNPGKGWVLYGEPFDKSVATIDMATTGYKRYNWIDIEPEEGNYNWKLIDDDINAWAAEGKKFAFGVMNANTSRGLPYITPKWVFDAGAAYVDCTTTFNLSDVTAIQRTPVWDDPVFLQKVKDFVQAMASRYDHNSNIAYIDIRSYGNYGEGHVAGLGGSIRLSPEKLQEHIKIYKDAFQNTRLVVPTCWYKEYLSVYETAANDGLGLRMDGVVGDPTNTVAIAYGKAPGIFEFYASYQWLKSSTNPKYHWDADKLRSDVNIGRPSYIGMGQWGNDALYFFRDERSLIIELANKMGYHFVLKKITLPQNMKASTIFQLGLDWENSGIAYLYESCHVALAILDTSNNVVKKYWLDQSNPKSWEPGKINTEKALVCLDNIADGEYKLAIGLFQEKEDQNPVYKIGNKGRTLSGWYIITDRIDKSGSNYKVKQ